MTTISKEVRFQNITIIRHYPDSPALVVCAVTEIEQVLLNLLKNAAHALATITDPIR